MYASTSEEVLTTSSAADGKPSRLERWGYRWEVMLENGFRRLGLGESAWLLEAKNGLDAMTRCERPLPFEPSVRVPPDDRVLRCVLAARRAHLQLPQHRAGVQPRAAVGVAEVAEQAGEGLLRRALRPVLPPGADIHQGGQLARGKQTTKQFQTFFKFSFLTFLTT